MRADAFWSILQRQQFCEEWYSGPEAILYYILEQCTAATFLFIYFLLLFFFLLGQGLYSATEAQ